MIAALKRAIAQLIGVVPALPPPPEFWIRELKDHGYRVAYRDGYWHWYHWGGSFSGRYTTERSAWGAAWEDFDQREDNT